MKRTIKIFKSFEEQEAYNLDIMRNTSPKERFQNLYRMQQLNLLIHPITNKERKITIQKNGYS